MNEISTMTTTLAQKRIDRLSVKEGRKLRFGVVLELYLISITGALYFDEGKN